MGKLAILPIDYHSIQQPLNFKKQILLFDKIIIEKESLGLAKTFVDFAIKTGNANVNRSNYTFNNQNVEYLQQEGLLEFDTINKAITVSVDSEEALFMQSMAIEANEINILNSQLKNGNPDTLTKLKGLLKQLPVSFARALSIRLKTEGLEAYPLYENEPDYSPYGKKAQILKFVLSQIPEPDDSVSWEQIIEFRKDPATLQKYYTLITWVNEVSKGEFNLSEIEEKYKALYYDYSEQYRIHNIKNKQGTIEILVTAAIDVISQQITSTTVSTSLFSIWKRQINLLDAELKFIGREVAYIHKIEQKFK